ncbi:MAG: hypothetical protein J5I94_13710 [Phaeodactylibacter sp.]|nr:hypothetical protein [Phaeodactylibacter sp.]
MQTANLFFSTLLFICISLSSGAQSLGLFPFLDIRPATNYHDCAAIFFEGEMLADEYSPEGKCKLEAGRKGTLTVATVNLSGSAVVPVENIAFKVAIKNNRTNTIWMYSEKASQEVQLEDILKKCEPGDRIIIMTVDQRYSLPHHEVEVAGGC